MTPQRSVASVSHQRNASRSTVRTRGLLVGGQEVLDAAEPARAERLRRAEPPGPDAEPGQVLVRPRRCAPVPSPAPRPDRTRRRSGCPSGSRRAPAAAASAPAGWPSSQRNAHSNVAVVSPISSSRSRHSASWSARSGRSRPGRRGGWRPAPARTAAAAGRGRRRRGCAGCAARSSRRRSRCRSGTDCPVPQANCRRRGCAGPARPPPPRAAGPRPRVPCPRARRRAGRCAGSAHGDCRPPERASNAHVVRLAPPVSGCRFSMVDLAERPVAGLVCQLLLVTCGRTRTAAGPPGGSGSPRRPR